MSWSESAPIRAISGEKLSFLGARPVSAVRHETERHRRDGTAATALTCRSVPETLDASLKRQRSSLLLLGLAALGPLAIPGAADPRVIVSAIANPAYTAHKFGEGRTRAETYVVMQGHYFAGGIADPSIEHMPFRKLAEVFAPELAKRQYWPAKDTKDADLLIVVHWGTTTPKISTMEMMARTNPLPDVTGARENKQMRMDAANAGGDFVSAMTAGLNNEDTRLFDMNELERLGDQVSNDLTSARAVQLLGYTKELRRYERLMVSPAEEYSLRLDLTQMRYFIIVRAYDLHALTAADRARPVWTLHLNMSSPGNDFGTAVDRMSVAAVNFVGRSTENVQAVLPNVPEGKVTIGPLVILGEAN